jgi:hypothetical protein
VAAAYLTAMCAMMCAQRAKDTAVATMAKIQVVLGVIASPLCVTNEAVILNYSLNQAFFACIRIMTTTAWRYTEIILDYLVTNYGSGN